MAVAFDAVSVLPFGTNPSNTHTPVGTPRGVLVIYIHPTADTPTVTYGGSNVPQRATFDCTVGFYDQFSMTVYTLGASIPTGAQTVAVSNASTPDGVGYVYTVTATGDTEYINSASLQSASQANPSTNLALSGRTCFVALEFASGHAAVGSTTPLSGWTSRHEGTDPGVVYGSYSYNTIASADVSCGWTQTAEDAFMAAAAISEVVGAASAPPVFRPRRGVVRKAQKRRRIL